MTSDEQAKAKTEARDLKAVTSDEQAKAKTTARSFDCAKNAALGMTHKNQDKRGSRSLATIPLLQRSGLGMTAKAKRAEARTFVAGTAPQDDRQGRIAKPQNFAESGACADGPMTTIGPYNGVG